MITIPVFQTTSSDFIQKITLVGQLVNIRIKYNIRSFCFHMDFTDQNNNSIYGIKLIPNWPILKGHKNLLSFSGDLIVISTATNTDKIITYDNFGIGWALTYLSEDELIIWRSENGL